MPNNTPTYWSADGVSLHTFAHSIESVGPGLRMAPYRGEDIVIPGRPGVMWVPKDVDSRTLPLGMWVRGLQDIGAGQHATTTQDFHNNWNNLVRLLYTPGRQFELTKRFYDGGILRQATALAEYASGMEPTLIGKNAAKFLVELKLADPYFYDDGTPQTFNLVNGDQVINVLGNVPTRRVTLTINGSRVNTTVRRKLPATPDHQVQYVPGLNSGEFVTIDSRNYSASTKKGALPAYDSSVDVRNSGSRAWLELAPGNNTINVSSTSGIGSIQLVVRGAWA